MTALNTTIVSSGLHSAPVWVVGTKYSARVRVIIQAQNQGDLCTFSVGGVPQLGRVALSIPYTFAGVIFDAVINFMASQTFPTYSTTMFNTICEITTIGVTQDDVSLVFGDGFNPPPVPVPMPNFVFSLCIGKNDTTGDDFEISYTSNPDKYLFGLSMRGSSVVQYISEFKGSSPVLVEISRVTSPWYVAVFTPSSTLIRKKFFQLQSSSSSLFLRS